MKEKPQKIFAESAESSMEPYTCQMVVCAGGNEDDAEKGGTAHFIELYFIHNACSNIGDKYIRIHGFTSFYYTCYYWGVSSMDEAVRSFHKFEEILNNMKNGPCNWEIFTETREELLEEIDQSINKSLDSLVKILNHDVMQFKLPIGNIDGVKKITANDIKNFLHSFYTDETIFKYIYDCSFQVSILSNPHLKKLGVWNTKDLIKQSDDEKNQIKVVFSTPNINVSKVRMIMNNNFINGLFDIVIGEIFMMQLCQYFSGEKMFKSKVTYENFFLGAENKYFIITMHDIGSVVEKAALLDEKKYEMPALAEKAADVYSYKEISHNIIKYLKSYDSTMAEQKEIRMELINYSAFSYESFTLSNNRRETAERLEKLNYEH